MQVRARGRGGGGADGGGQQGLQGGPATHRMNTCLSVYSEFATMFSSCFVSAWKVCFVAAPATRSEEEGGDAVAAPPLAEALKARKSRGARARGAASRRARSARSIANAVVSGCRRPTVTPSFSATTCFVRAVCAY